MTSSTLPLPAPPAQFCFSPRRLLARVLLALLIAAALLGAYFGFLQITGNFAPVIAGEVYRSAQPTPADIRRYAERYAIRSIINLRGKNDGKAWYDGEVEMARALGIQHFDLGMSARRPVSWAQMEQLIQLMRDAPKPLLIHCNAGADRSGLASALYLAAIAGEPPESAARQLSFYFGHIPVPVRPEYAMDRSLAAARDWLPQTATTIAR
ncbi:dual specificity protein phosphatase family protein [Rhizobium sp. CSW-27]|uniref:dual specificity protein phosphatase family protein n=1 Tax=Rhizobium sp. CSW-27 TaxID=2839985 RepID=UPI001C0096E4|nr:dual specificity protein phosphatase family protein [Rhizobium sp. CSW-27]MBT9369833.1 dual specificity protein phosphatase family protein [Rhizobium sp. CSW-27]